jgi:endonuclease YncB( thermonuclease family)
LIASPLLGIGAAWLWSKQDVATEATSFFVSAPASNDSFDAGVGEQYFVNFSECSTLARRTCVVDGDTFWLEGVKIRIADINTPEVSDPQCGEEAALGARATDRLVELLNAGGFSLQAVDREKDAYGRTLRIVIRGGASIGDTLVAEGLAETWTGRRRNWC